MQTGVRRHTSKYRRSLANSVFSLGELAQLDIAPCMGNACHTTQYADVIYLLCQIEEPFRHVLSFLEIPWLQQRYIEPLSHWPRVLLVTAGMSTGVITAHQHQSATA